MAGISIQFIQPDEFAIQMGVTATNNWFSAEATVYTDWGGQELISLGNRLKGFPKQANDVEEMELGRREWETQWGYGDVVERAACLGLKFYCLDRFGHLAVFVTIENLRYERDLSDKVSFQIRFEPAQLDEFIEEIIKLGKTQQGKATLEDTPW
jgi:hypothetical protein